MHKQPKEQNLWYEINNLIYHNNTLRVVICVVVPVFLIQGMSEYFQSLTIRDVEMYALCCWCFVGSNLRFT